MPTDGGPDGGATTDAVVDPCAGRALCTAAGTACDGDVLVTCAADADGCMVETSTDCGLGGEICNDVGGEAACIDPCSLVPEADRCDTDGARACSASTLEVCAMDAQGCLVLERTDCAASPGGVCDSSGAMPVCALPPDPCAAIPAADRCTTEGASCDADTLVDCAPNAFGCLVVSRTDCTSRGGTCDAATAACVVTGDPCAGVAQCAAAGTACDGPELVVCAPDAFGCLVETRTACTAVTFGFCDADATPSAACSTAATDPCMGVTQCGGASRTCPDRSTVEICAPNAFGCFVTTTTDCATTGEICSDAGGDAMCVDPCSLVTVCSSASYCDGADAVTCAPDADGCLVESGRTTCAATEVCDASGGTANCVDTICPEAATRVLDCASGTVSGDTAQGSTANSGAYGSCYSGTGYAGAEQYWRFRSGRTNPVIVTVTTTAPSTSRDFDLFVLDGGDGTSTCASGAAGCLDSSRASGAGESVEFVAQPGDTDYVVFDLYSTPVTDTAAYEITVTCVDLVCGNGAVQVGEGCDDGGVVPGDGCSDTCTIESGYNCTGSPSTCVMQPPHALCAGARSITSDTSISGENIALGGPRPTGTGCGTSSGNNAYYYAVTIPASTRVDVTTAGTFDRVLLVEDACDAGACTYRTDTSPESASLTNTGAAPITQIVAIHNFSSSGTGTFDITFKYTTLAANATCSGAIAIGTGVTGDVTAGGSRPTGASCGTSAGPVLYYSVLLPANSVTTVTGTPTGASWDLTLRSLADCSGACLTSLDATTSGNPENLQLSNLTSSDVTRLIAVGADSASTFGTFTLSATSVPVAANSTCAGAIPIGSGIVGADLRAGAGPRPVGANCGTSVGPVLYYSVTLPPQTTTTVTGTPTGSSWDLTLRSLFDCSGDCIAHLDAVTSGSSERLTLLNQGTTEITRLIAVGADSSSIYGTFDLSAISAPLPTNTTCADATVVTTDAAYYGQPITLGGPRPQGTGCGTSSGDNAFYYSVTIPPLTTVRVTTAGSFDRVLLVQGSCGATSCEYRTDSSPESWTYANSTASAVTKIVVVHNFSSTGSGSFDITFSYTPFSYALTTIAGACVDASAGVVVTDVTGDDDSSAISALPFAFTYFGTAMTHWSVNTNGLVQLYDTASGTTSSAFSNAAIPNPSAPNGMIAAFWDDLQVTATSAVRTLTSGTTGSQLFVVEWNDVLVRSVTGSTVRFQAHLYEGSNVVELHYCAASGTEPQLTGSSATVGIESPTGLDGVGVSNDTAGATSVGTGYRFTPL